MLETISNMRTRYPDKRLFVIAGKEHFTASMVQKKLEGQSYIALKPEYEITEKDIEDFYEKIMTV
jgi:hypothetical protein